MTINGTTGNDILNGTAGDDEIWGLEGNDTITGGAGKDEIYGNEGVDDIQGNQGNDTIHGGQGNDTIHGGQDNDSLYGGVGNDELDGGLGDDTVEGGDGQDTIFGSDGDDTLWGNSEAQSALLLSQTNDSSDLLYGGSGTDNIYGNQGDDYLYGGDGNDYLYGGRQNDYIDGGDGIDRAIYDNRASSEFQIVKNNDGTVTVIHSLGYLEAGTDTITNVEYLEFDDQTIAVDYYNDAPTSIQLSNSSVSENVPAGSLVGNLSTIDPDAGDTHTYSLTGADAGYFQILDNQLRFANNVSPNYEIKSTYNLTVTSKDNYEAEVSNNFMININDINEAPTDIHLTNLNIDENSLVGTVVGILSANNEEVNDILTYTIANDPSGYFEIVGNELRVASGAGLDYETATSHNVTVQVSDGTSTLSESFTIQVNDIDPEPIYGTPGDDVLVGTSGDDTIIGLEGDDQIDGSFGNDWLYGGGGNDILIGGLSADHMFAGAGDDTVYYTNGDYFFENGQANDVGGSGYDTLIVEAGNVFSSANISLYGFEAFQGAEQNDSVEGRDGTINYNFAGSAGDDTLTGNAGDDVLDGGIGNDWLYGGDGNDVLIGGLSADHMFAGAGDDTVYYTNGDYFFENGQANDVGGTGRDIMIVEAGNSYSTSNISLYGFEIFLGAELSDNIEGRDGSINYEFYGNGGNDTLSGDYGDDILAGGTDSDTLAGGGGSDTFIFNSGDGQDTIQDFSAGAMSDDVIELSGISGVSSFNHVLTAAYQDGSDTVIDFGNSDTLTLVDVDRGTLHEDDFVFA